MTPEHHKRGGASLAMLNTMLPWEAELVLNLRLWCDGPDGQRQVRTTFARVWPQPEAQNEICAFEDLVGIVTKHAHRPLVRHEVTCSCVGSDECIFTHLVSTACEGHLADAALIATLLVSASQAEHVALLAGQVGNATKRMVAHYDPRTDAVSATVHRLH